MTKVYVLWGILPDELDETLITETTDAQHLHNAKEWAKSKGITSLRVMETYDGEKPNFAAAVTA